MRHAITSKLSNSKRGLRREGGYLCKQQAVGNPWRASLTHAVRGAHTDERLIAILISRAYAAGYHTGASRVHRREPVSQTCRTQVFGRGTAEQPCRDE